MLIRHAEADRDGAACAAIYAPYVTNSPVSFETVPPIAEEFKARIARLERTHPFLVAVALQDSTGSEAVAGFAYAGPHHERAGYRWAATVSVYVDAGYHRRGVGRALYGTLLDLLARQGLWMACSGITLPNDASVALHESCGFEPVGVYRRIGWKAGSWRDVGWWQLALRTATADDCSAPPEPEPPARLHD
ncbi:MAG: N-acetyltransferase family protein [Solirubrobacteraceae bacterium]